jgi:hypothetical protein
MVVVRNIKVLYYLYSFAVYLKPNSFTTLELRDILMMLNPRERGTPEGRNKEKQHRNTLYGMLWVENTRTLWSHHAICNLTQEEAKH